MDEYDLNQVVELKDKTPASHAVEIIMILDGMWLSDFKGDMSHKLILTELMNAEDIDGAAEKEKFWQVDNSELKNAYLALLRVIYSYCLQAIREYMANDDIPNNLAWAYLVEAERELSGLDNYRFVQLKIKERASKAGKAAHANTPQAKAKKEIEQIFNESNYPFHVRGHTAKFVKEMYEQYGDKITNIKTIENWVAELKRKQ